MSRQASKLPLDERIASAFCTPQNSEAVGELITEANAAAAVADAEAQRARERALDPALSAADVRTARSEMDDAAFRRDRLQVAVPKLDQKYRELRFREDNQRRWAAYESAKTERDQLAHELGTRYPGIVASLVDLLKRIEESEHALSRINKTLPAGANSLVGAEAMARGLSGFDNGLHTVPQFTKSVRLPAFEYHQSRPYSWPVST